MNARVNVDLRPLAPADHCRLPSIGADCFIFYFLYVHIFVSRIWLFFIVFYKVAQNKLRDIL